MTLDPNSDFEREKRDRFKLKYIAMGEDKPKGDKELTPISKHTPTTAGKFTLKSINTRKKRRRPGSLEEEDIDLLRTYFGSSGEGVSKVNETTHYNQDGRWY
jgi:hypothetical protein